MMDFLELDTREAEVTRLVWVPGSPYDPPGYYAIIKFNGTSHYVFLEMAEDPREEN